MAKPSGPEAASRAHLVDLCLARNIMCYESKVAPDLTENTRRFIFDHFDSSR